MGAMLPPMRELYPAIVDDVDPFERYRSDERSRVAGDGPWVLVNMITTVDGATSVEGRSGGLGGPADKVVFGAIRAVADAILVGAATVRAEQYRPPRTPPGRDAPPRLAIVTLSLGIDPSARIFDGARDGPRPIIVTAARSDASRRAALSEVADIVIAGEEEVDLREAIVALGERGASVVLCEGGPSLNGHLVRADLVDELCLTLAPLVAGGDSPRLAHGDAAPVIHPLRLDRIIEADGLLFLRYVRGDAVNAASGPSTS
jgi:riboflavin biosynthesis pyrimidine reductase